MANQREGGIPWTDVTDNVIVAEGGGWWCRKITEGCKNCYAANLNQSTYFHGNKLPYSGEPPALLLKSDLIKSWARQRTAKKHFVASMTDVFGEWVAREWQFEILDGMLAAPMQTFQVLTKRADVMLEAVTQWLAARSLDSLPPNVWPMVTAENQREADRRIPYLLRVPAAVRGLSCEPLLEGIVLQGDGNYGRPEVMHSRAYLRGDTPDWQEYRPGIDWVIVGGESGPGARPCELAWIRSVVGQCRAANVPVFVKQLGSRFAVDYYDHEYRDEYESHGWEWPEPMGWDTRHGQPPIGSRVRIALKDRKGGDITEFPEDLRVRQFPQTAGG